MKTTRDRIHNFVDLIHSIRDKHLGWQLANQGDQLRLAQARSLAEENLAAELTKKSVQLAHEINLLKTQQATELAMLKTRCNEDLKDYQQYLDAVNSLKREIQISFVHLPEVFAHTIHHHAKALLNAMWETDDLEEKLKHEAKLITFMTTAHKEANQTRSDKSNEGLPENTLKLISQDRDQFLTH